MIYQVEIELCINWDLISSDISRHEYSNIRTAAKAFVRRSAGPSSFDKVDEKSVISLIVKSDVTLSLRGRQIRQLMSKFVDPRTFNPLTE